jgi:hypothetical protein
MVTLNKIVVGNSWKCTFWACEFQKIIWGGGGRNSAIQPMFYEKSEAKMAAIDIQ